ncbi:MAG TPA: HAMP domain-containing sensor histidine kinase [Pyrinomonadaceae bacterium]|jgi:signal transduction histidine kinase
MSTTQREDLAALAVLCDAGGVVRQVLHDGLDAAPLTPGQPFESVLDCGSGEKCRAFLDAVRTKGAAYDWEMNVPAGGRFRLLRFSGSMTADGIFIAGAATRSGITRIYEQYVRVEACAPAAPAAGVPPASPQDPSRAERDTELYDELTRLNNELVTAQRELVKRNVELERLNEIKNRFIGIAAHDLRNPLQVIEGYSEMLAEGILGAVSTEQQKVISVIRKNSDFMLKLVTDLLHISKVEAGKLHLELQETDLPTLLETNVELNRLLAAQKQIDISLSSGEGIPALRVDAAKIEQVLNNLIGNAIKFSHPKTTVEVRAARREGDVVVDVRDEGQGIPAGEMDRLFIPFESLSVKSTGGEQSTGLGLAIARRIVEGHGGEVWVRSEVGVGSTFSFSLPLSGR